MEEKILKIETFFRLDLKIKDLLYKSAPDSLYFSENRGIKYGENLLYLLDLLKDYFMKIIMEMEFDSHIEQRVIKLLDICNKKIESSNYDFDRLKAIYENYIFNMNDEIIEKIKNECFGYNCWRDINALVDECKTFNEILHLLHSYVVNNENYYHAMPLILRKSNLENYDISLYGRKNIFAENIYNNFPLNMLCGETDILALDNKVLMMIRDRGHALSIQLDMTDEGVYVDYFIPKICNVSMVNQLKGVIKVNEQSTSTVGTFFASYDRINDELFKFINGVPMDVDIEMAKKY